MTVSDFQMFQVNCLKIRDDGKEKGNVFPRTHIRRGRPVNECATWYDRYDEPRRKLWTVKRFIHGWLAIQACELIAIDVPTSVGRYCIWPNRERNKIVLWYKRREIRYSSSLVRSISISRLFLPPFSPSFFFFLVFFIGKSTSESLRAKKKMFFPEGNRISIGPLKKNGANTINDNYSRNVGQLKTTLTHHAKS